MPLGSLMGSGAEASEPLPLVSIVSAADTSMGCSAVRPVAGGPRSQQSPATNFTGLEEGDVRHWCLRGTGPLFEKQQGKGRFIYLTTPMEASVQ